jgi:predicted TIM-barrel fold metal-dependent hydrolase
MKKSAGQMRSAFWKGVVDMLKKIDMHVHTIMRRGILRMGTNTTFATPEELSLMYERLGIEKGVILPEVNFECASHMQSNEDAIRIVEKYPDMFYWFCNIDPRMERNDIRMDLSRVIENYKALGAKGVGEVCANLYFDDPFMENLFYHCEKTEMPVLFHIGPQVGGCYGIVDDLGLPRLEKMLKKFPGLQFIGHSQPFWAEIGADATEANRNSYPTGKVVPGRLIELFELYPNLYGDMSAGSGFNAVARDPEFGYAFIEKYQDRLYFGTDICAPENDMQLSFWLDEAVQNKKISQTAYEKVCRGNALKLLER